MAAAGKNTLFPPEDLGRYEEELAYRGTTNQEAGWEVYEMEGLLTGTAVQMGEDYTSEWFTAYCPENLEPWFGHGGQTHNVSSADLGGWYVMLQFSAIEAGKAQWMDLSYPAGDWTLRLYWEAEP